MKGAVYIIYKVTSGYCISNTSGCRCDMQPSRIITDYRLSQKQAFPLMKCIRQHVYNVSAIIVVLVWRKSIHFWRRYAHKNDFTFSFPIIL